MVMEIKKAQQVVESLFTFDNVGDAMSAVRKAVKADPSALQKAQKNLVKELIDHAVRSAGDNSAESLSLITKVVEERVQQYMAGIKAASSGCAGTA